jgi:hypothetical protein
VQIQFRYLQRAARGSRNDVVLVYFVVVIVLTVSVLSDGNYSLCSVSKSWVQKQDGHDDDEADEAGGHDVDHHRLGKHVVSVIRTQIVDTGKGPGPVEGGIRQKGHPFWVGKTVKKRVQK